MKLPLFRVADGLPGTLWIMPHPPAVDLPGAMSFFAASGVEQILCLMEPEEAKALGLAEEEAACKAQGLKFRSHPIADFSLPTKADFVDLVASVAQELSEGHRIAVHCRAGIGRSGMVAACTLIALGARPEAALEKVTSARGVSVPDTVAQREYILNFTTKAN